jgi:hypothetical protein
MRVSVAFLPMRAAIRRERLRVVVKAFFLLSPRGYEQT